MAYVTIFQTGDPIVAEMLVDVLQNEGLNARLLGTKNGAAIGVGQHILRLRIEVPSEQVAQGTEIVDAFEKGEVVPDPATADSDADADDEDADAKTPPRKNRMLAAGVSFLIPGGSHFYARRFWTGAMFAVAVVVAFVGTAQPHPVRATAAFITLLALVGFDILLGQFAVSGFNAGIRRGAVRQLLVGAGALAVAGALGAVVAPRLNHVKKQPAGEFQPPPVEGTLDSLFR